MRGAPTSGAGAVFRITAAHSWSYRSDNPICTRTRRTLSLDWRGPHKC